MLKFATIGSSWITDEYIHGAKDTGLWELTAIYSRDEARGRAYAEKHGAKFVFTSIEELAACPDVDAVYVASPNYAHYAQCRALLEGGKHVICEKPVCAQAEKVRELVRLSQEKGLIFMEAIMFLHQPQLKNLNAAIAELGEISMVKLDFCQRSSKLDSYLRGELPNIFNPEMETGALMDLGVYCVYPALYLFGEPERVEQSVALMKSGADGNGVVTFVYPHRLVTLTYSKLGQSAANSDIQGVNGTISIESISKLNGIILRRNDGAVENIHGHDEKYKLMGNEARDFYRYITEPETSREEYEVCQSLSISVAAYMEDIRRSCNIRFLSDNM